MAQKCIEEGASRVVGIDLSPHMITLAEARRKSDKLTLRVGDIRKLEKIDVFDMVMACWVLVHAEDETQLRGIVQSAFDNLRPGGVFTGITAVPHEKVSHQNRTCGVTVQCRQRLSTSLMASTLILATCHTMQMAFQ